MKIKVTSVYVDDQDKALRFYTEVLGFAKKADFSQGPFRWLTVASPEEPDGTELQLALNDNPAAKAYQQAMFQQGQPGAMFYTDDVKGDYERIKAHHFAIRRRSCEAPIAMLRTADIPAPRMIMTMLMSIAFCRSSGRILPMNGMIRTKSTPC